jgi:hypothetical protein
MDNTTATRTEYSEPFESRFKDGTAMFRQVFEYVNGECVDAFVTMTGRVERDDD